MADHPLTSVLGFEISALLKEIRCFRLYRFGPKRSGAMRKTSVSKSENALGWDSVITLLFVTAYQSFD